jgi:hypothetical protein
LRDTGAARPATALRSATPWSGSADFASDLGDIIEALDINPFLVRKLCEGAFALDALVVLRPPEEPMTSDSGRDPP